MSADRPTAPAPRPVTVLSRRQRTPRSRGRRLRSVLRRVVRPRIARPSRRYGEHGMVTAEIATALPALVVITAGLLFVIGAVGAQLRCSDLSREAARQLARGQDQATVSQEVLVGAPPDARLSVSRAGGLVTVRITAHAPTLGALARLGTLVVSGSASALDETAIGLTP